MKRSLIILLVVFFFACSPDVEEPSLDKNSKRAALPADFISSFDRLFLSPEPLRYQDNVVLLNAIHPENLTDHEKEIVRENLKKFLSFNYDGRGYAKDCYQTGIADPFAFLRLKCVKILSHIGKKEDAAFIRQLYKRRGVNHPLFGEECEKAIKELENR
jgi:hypothetical protein